LVQKSNWHDEMSTVMPYKNVICKKIDNFTKQEENMKIILIY
jgi:hypothetical protein